MTKQITPGNPRFVEVLAGLLHHLLKAAGTMVPIKGQEQIRTIAQKLAETIEYHAERKSVEVAKLLQTAVKNAFEKLEDDVAKLEKELAELKTEVQNHRRETAQQYRDGAIKSQRY